MWEIRSITRTDQAFQQPGIETYEVYGLFNGQAETHLFVVEDLVQPEGDVIHLVRAPHDLDGQIIAPGGSVQLTYESIQTFHRAVLAARSEPVD